MTCRKVRKLIPLAAGNDLRPRQARAVRAHLEACPGCRQELAAFRRDLAGITAAASEESAAGWNESEWRALVAGVTERALGKSADGRPGVAPEPAFRPRWATAAALGALLALVIMAALFRGPGLRRERPTGRDSAAAAQAPPRQDRMSVTMVSPDSGLQVVWILDRNFEWKGDHE